MLLTGFMAENCALDLPMRRVEMMVVTKTSGASSVSQNSGISSKVCKCEAEFPCLIAVDRTAFCKLEHT